MKRSVCSDVMPCVPTALQRQSKDINTRAADMWSFAILLWELETREVPFADLSSMEVGMKVRVRLLRSRVLCFFFFLLLFFFGGQFSLCSCLY